MEWFQEQYKMMKKKRHNFRKMVFQNAFVYDNGSQ